MRLEWFCTLLNLVSNQSTVNFLFCPNKQAEKDNHLGSVQPHDCNRVPLPTPNQLGNLPGALAAPAPPTPPNQLGNLPGALAAPAPPTPPKLRAW